LVSVASGVPLGGASYAPSRLPSRSGVAIGLKMGERMSKDQTGMRTVIGLFDSASEATRAIDELQSLGFGADRIGVVTNVACQGLIEAQEPIDLQSLTLADVGEVAACGPLKDALDHPSATLAIALQRFGLTAELADHYASGVRHGETLESLTVEEKDSDRVLSVMMRRAGRLGPPPRRSR
jgi:hypothetical protein